MEKERERFNKELREQLMERKAFQAKNNAMAYDRKSFQIEKEEMAMMRKAYIHEKAGIQKTRDAIKFQKQITSTKKATTSNKQANCTFSQLVSESFWSCKDEQGKRTWSQFSSDS
ncbi:hypothetical protein NQZ68_039091, partial [Dissostichus eleginoides]